MTGTNLRLANPVLPALFHLFASCGLLSSFFGHLTAKH